MAAVDGLTSGTRVVDDLIDGVHVGDNLVFVGDEDVPLDLLVDRFVAATRGRVPLVIVTVAEPWDRETPPDGVTVLDWSAALGGREATPGSLAADAGFDTALRMLLDADEQVGTGAAFVIDGLGAIQEHWGPDAALELFLSTCPRLYRRRSLALWPVRRDAHRASFLRRLTEITQVVIELAGDDGRLALTVRKADGRDEHVVGRRVHAEAADGDLHPLGEPTRTRELLGTAIRDQRLGRGLSQAELARRVGITPSALSQIERGVRRPAGDTLVRLWEVLGVPFGPSELRDDGYHLARRSGRERTHPLEGMTAERIVDGPATGEVWQIGVEPGASGTRGPFAVKAPETVLVLRGVLDLRLGGRTETLHEGDAVVATNASVTGWSNPGTEPAELLWTVHHGS